MSGGRVMEPWCNHRYISLGAGPRERATQCRCNYRSSSIKGSCYTTLKNEPPLASCDKQQNWHTFKGEAAPLVRVVRRESKQNIMETPRRTRPFSAATCTQRDVCPDVVPPQQNNFMISVKGKNMSWHERPLSKRFSESCISDQAIKSIQQATTEELTKVSSFLSNSRPVLAPKPPVPSPDQSEDEDQSYEEILEEFVVEREISEISSIASSLSRGQIDAGNLEENSTDKLVDFDRESQSREMKVKHSFKETKSIGRRAADGKCGSKKSLDFRVPTGDDSDISESEDDLFEVTNLEAKTPFALVDSENHLPVAKFPGQAPKVNNHREKRRPYSAFAALGSSVKSKTIEFVSEEELSGAKCHVSERTLETMLYMDYLREKKRLAREAKGDGKYFYDKDSFKKDVAKSSDVVLNNRVALPPEMHVSPKPPVQRKIYQSQPHRTLITSQEETNEIRPGIEQQSPTEKVNRLREKRVASARNILMKAERELNETKEERKQQASMIWRSITQIDDSNENISHASRNSLPEDSANGRDSVHAEAVEETDELAMYKAIVASPSQQDDVTNRSNGNSSVAEEESKKLRQKHSVKFDISESNSKLCCGAPQGTNDCAVVQEERHSPKSSKTRPSSSITRTSSPDKILRPTSAVILRHVQSKKEDSSPKRNKTRLKPRPISSTAGSRKDKIPQEQKRRPASAAVLRASTGASRKSGDNVISSEGLDLKLENKRVSFSSNPTVTTTTTTNPVRRNSAKTQSSLLKSNLKKRPVSAPIRTVQSANRACGLDIVQEEQKN